MGWIPLKLDDDSWGAVHDAPQLLPAGLVGRRIVISAKGRDGQAWTAKVLEVLERTSERAVVRDTKPPWVKASGEQAPAAGIMREKGGA